MRLLSRGKKWDKKKSWDNGKNNTKKDIPKSSQIERQELYCHECERYVQFNIDMSLNGNHVLNCPNCGHEHCRVVSNGKITDDRWDQRNGNAQRVYYATNIAYSITSTAGADGYTYVNSWSNTSTSATAWR